MDFEKHAENEARIMRFLVVNGSPKGAESITFQTVLYLEKLHPEHTFETLHAGKTPWLYEKHPEMIAENESVRRQS